MFDQAFREKRVLVTGHTGFKGAWLTLWLTRLGAEVVGLSDQIPTAPSHFSAARLEEAVRTHWVDVRDADAVRQVISDEAPDFVFHLAAQSLVRVAYRDPVATYATNAIGTANVLEALRGLQNACNAVLITSDKCYENRETYYGYRETDPLGGADPYSASKAAAELLISSHVRSFFPAGRTTVRIAVGRAGNVVGGGDWAADRVVPDIIRAWSKGEPATIRQPAATRPWQYVLEPVSGYLHLGAELARHSELHGEAFNFGPAAAEMHPVRDVVTALERHLPGLHVRVEEGPGPFYEAGRLRLSCDKAHSVLQWRSVLEFEETMQATAEWYARFCGHGSTGVRAYSERQIDRYAARAARLGRVWARDGAAGGAG